MMFLGALFTLFYMMATPRLMTRMTTTTTTHSPRCHQLKAHKLDNLVIQDALTPLANNILVKVHDVPTTTAGGIYIPDNAKTRPTQGTVVAIGDGLINKETGVRSNIGVSIGDSVIYGKFDGSELKYDDANHQFIKDEDVLLKFHGNPTLETVSCVKDQVLVELPSKEEALSSSTLVLAPVMNKNKKPDHGVVKKVGPGKESSKGALLPMPVTAGDHIKFREYAGTEITLEGKEYLVLHAHEILAKW